MEKVHRPRLSLDARVVVVCAHAGLLVVHARMPTPRGKCEQFPTIARLGARGFESGNS